MNALLTMVLSNAVLASVLAAFVYLISRRISHAPLMRALWLLVLLKFMMPPVWSVEWAILSEPQSSSSVLRMVPEVGDHGKNTQQAVRKASRDRSVDTTLENRDSQTSVTQEPAGMTWAISWESAIVGIWFTGSVIWMLVAVVQVVSFKRLLRQGEVAPIALQNMTDRLTRQFQLHDSPRVLVVPDRIHPLLCGLRRRPVIVIPAALLAQLNVSQQETVITHELAHLSRGDRWVRILETLVMALYWWHPVARWTCRQLRESEETCCDGWVLRNLPGSSKSYARSLLETVEFLSPQQPVLPPITSGFGSVTAFKRRLEMVLEKNTCCQTSWRQRGLLMLFGTAALVLSMAFETEKPVLADGLPEAAKTLIAMAAPNSSITSLAYSSDGNLLAGGSFDGGVRVWDASTGKLLRNLKGHKSTVRGLAFAPQGTLLASGSDDKTVILWDAHTGNKLHKLTGLGGEIHSLAFTDDGKTVWFFSDKITAYSINTGKKTSTIDAKIDPRGFPRIDVSPDEKTLVITSLEPEKRIAAHLYDMRTGRRIRSISEEGGGFLAVKFFPDGKHLAGSFISRDDGKSVRVYDFETGECQQVLRPTSDEFFAINISPDGKLLASGGDGPSIEENTRLGRQTRSLSQFTVWDLASGKAQLTGTGVLGRISSLCFSPDNKRIAYCDDASVTVINIESGEPVWTGRYGFFPN